MAGELAEARGVDQVLRPRLPSDNQEHAGGQQEEAADRAGERPQDEPGDLFGDEAAPAPGLGI
jgi:hypothetical protein